MIALLADAVGPKGLVRGQWRDLRGASAASAQGGIHALEETNQLKTGSLFVAALEMSAVDAGADESTRTLLRDCAERIGQAFQLKDDLDDLDGEATTPAAEARPTLPLLLGRRRAEQRLQSHLQLTARFLEDAFAGRSDGMRCLIRYIAQTAAGERQRATSRSSPDSFDAASHAFDEKSRLR